MEPKINFIHICDYASPGEVGKLNILGIFESIFPTIVPYVHPQLYIVTNVSIKKRGSYRQIIKIVRDSDNFEIVKPLEFAIPIEELPALVGEAKVGFIGQMNGINFDEFGSYTVQVFIDSLKIGESRINVIKRV